MRKAKMALAAMLITMASITANAQKSENTAKEVFNLNKQMEDNVGYAQAVKVVNMLYISGTVGWGSMPDAIKLAYDRLEQTLKHYNLTFADVVKENLYTTAIDSVKKYASIRRDYYKSDFPAATWVEVKRLYTPEIVLEVELIAVIPQASKKKK